MDQEVITVKCECPSCGGTGLFRDWTCHDGAALVCRDCNGTGAKEIHCTPFTERKEATGVKRVFVSNVWRHLYSSKQTGSTLDFSQYGCTYEDWKKGVEPKPLPDE